MSGDQDHQVILKSDKWWYRLLQVAYVLFAFFYLIVLIALLFEAVPTLDKYGSKYSIICDDGRPFGHFNGSNLNYTYDDYSSDATREMARFLCSQPPYASTQDMYDAYAKVPKIERAGLLNAGLKNNPSIIPNNKNYRITIIEKVYDGSWGLVIGSAIVGVIILIIILLLIRAIFLYILFKESFVSNLLVFRFWRRRKIHG